MGFDTENQRLFAAGGMFQIPWPDMLSAPPAIVARAYPYTYNPPSAVFGARVDYTAVGAAGIDFRAVGDQPDYVADGSAGIDFTPRRTGQPDYRADGKPFDYTGREV